MKLTNSKIKNTKSGKKIIHLNDDMSTLFGTKNQAHSSN